MEILRILVNEKQRDSFDGLTNGDVIDLFCCISPESSIVEAYQEIMKSYDYRTAGIYHVIESVAQSPSYSSVQSICLAHCGLVDGDVFHFLLPLQIPLNSLTKLELNDNQLTDIAATMLAIWVMRGNCPQLREIRLGGNCWHGKGLSKFFFSLRDQVRIELLDVTRLRVEDEGVGMLTSLMKNFVPSFDGATHALRGFRFCQHILNR